MYLEGEAYEGAIPRGKNLSLCGKVYVLLPASLGEPRHYVSIKSNNISYLLHPPTFLVGVDIFFPTLN